MLLLVYPKYNKKSNICLGMCMCNIYIPYRLDLQNAEMNESLHSNFKAGLHKFLRMSGARTSFTFENMNYLSFR